MGKLTGNYNYKNLEIDGSDPSESDFISYFNTPENMYSFTFSNREVFKNFGFSASLDSRMTSYTKVLSLICISQLTELLTLK